MTLTCPICGAAGSAPTHYRGRKVKCPACKQAFTVTEGSSGATTDQQPSLTAQPERKPCPFCSEAILATARKCKHCGEFLDESLAPESDAADNSPSAAMDTLEALAEMEQAESASAESKKLHPVAGFVAFALIGLMVMLVIAGIRTEMQSSDRGFAQAMVILGVLAAGVVWLAALVDCLKNEPSDCNDKIIWFLVILFLSVLGAILYFAIRRPQRPVR